MAYRDKNQGFGFVYTDLSKILAERDNSTDSNHTESKLKEHKPKSPQTLTPTSYINFNKDPKLPSQATTSNSTAESRNTAILDIKESLDRLQSLHHKLHIMLEDLNRITDKKKK